ncbi:MAG: glycosyltransferase family 2 protein [Fuerstiella sp.]
MISDDFPSQPDCDVSIVVPVYRSAEFLAQSVSSICDAMDARHESFEIVLVEDGSPDDSWSVVETIQADRPETITAVQLNRNFGQHNALMCGFRHSRGAIIVTIDDDLQNPASEIPVLLDAIDSSDADLVYGVPTLKHHAKARNLGSDFINRFFQIVFGTGVRVTSFRAVRRPLISSILTYTLNFTYVDGLLAWNTQKIQSAAVQHVPRQSGTSGYSIGKLMVLAINLFTNFSVLPLQIASAIGLTFSAAGLTAGTYYLVRALTTSIPVPGYASIIVAVMVLGGIQLLAIGVIGEYVGRMHLNVNRKPQYSMRCKRLRSVDQANDK